VDTSKQRRMSMMARYTKEFRENALRLCEARGWRVAEVARELGVKYQTLYDWVLKTRGPVSDRAEATPAPAKSLEEEARDLRRENRRLAEELEIAKKAAAFFARHQK
jgi:transposase